MRAHIVVNKIVDCVNLCGKLGWVEVHCRGAWQRDAVQHAHDVAALVAHQAPRLLVHEQRRCAAASVAGAGGVVHLPAMAASSVRETSWTAAPSQKGVGVFSSDACYTLTDSFFICRDTA